MDLKAITALAETRLAMGDVRLKDFRQTHLHLLKQNGFKPDDEYYKYTNVGRFIEEMKYAPMNNNFDLDSYLDPKIPTLIFVDGDLQFTDLKIPGLKTTILTTPMPNGRTNPLTSLHHGLLTDGVRIEVEKNTKIESPIRILSLFTKTNINAPTVEIVLGVHSELTLIEENVGCDPVYSVVSENFVKVGAGAKFEHIQLDTGASEALHHGSTFVEVEKDGNYRNVVLHVSGKLNRRNLELKLNAPGANGESYNLYLTNAQEHSDINTVIHHLAADSTSNQLAKGILDGESKGIFTGRIHIYKDAQRVASGQLNKNLLLSKKAQAHSQPQLEIFADDVKCSHGSTTGQLSPEELFYFSARGIPQDKARTLLAHGFGLEVVMKIQNTVAREKISALVLEQLKTKFKIGVPQ